ncbi:unnamed protein product [Durusdinium trenchii]|uniref:Uncharacterized protein n=2 Tax=Durusdinium trenchii TaxID=1381693 RepID=A0ABP0PPA7_9DINO
MPSRKAYKELLASKWVWKPGKCQCGGSFAAVSWKTCNSRGFGRLFYRCEDCESFKDVMNFSALPTLRWPIVHYWFFLQQWFANSKRPSSEEIARMMGVSGQACSAARRLGEVLLRAEALCAQKTQDSRKLSGLLEVDGTSIRKFVLPGSTTLRYTQYFGALKRGTRCIHLYRLPDADSKSFGKPPPESFARIQKTDFMRQVLPMTPGLGKTSLISDGAPPAYLKLCPELKVLHRACCHSKGQFVERSRIHGLRTEVHTGGIDSCWKLCKAAIPPSVLTKSDGSFNPKIDVYIRSWQWRWENTTCTNLCKKTAQVYLRQDA